MAFKLLFAFCLLSIALCVSSKKLTRNQFVENVLFTSCLGPEKTNVVIYDLAVPSQVTKALCSSLAVKAEEKMAVLASESKIRTDSALPSNEPVHPEPPPPEPALDSRSPADVARIADLIRSFKYRRDNPHNIWEPLQQGHKMWRENVFAQFTPEEVAENLIADAGWLKPDMLAVVKNAATVATDKDAQSLLRAIVPVLKDAIRKGGPRFALKIRGPASLASKQKKKRVQVLAAISAASLRATSPSMSKKMADDAAPSPRRPIAEAGFRRTVQAGANDAPDVAAAIPDSTPVLSPSSASPPRTDSPKPLLKAIQSTASNPPQRTDGPKAVQRASLDTQLKPLAAATGQDQGQGQGQGQTHSSGVQQKPLLPPAAKPTGAKFPATSFLELSSSVSASASVGNPGYRAQGRGLWWGGVAKWCCDDLSFSPRLRQIVAARMARITAETQGVITFEQVPCDAAGYKVQIMESETPLDYPGDPLLFSHQRVARRVQSCPHAIALYQSTLPPETPVDPDSFLRWLQERITQATQPFHDLAHRGYQRLQYHSAILEAFDHQCDAMLAVELFFSSTGGSSSVVGMQDMLGRIALWSAGAVATSLDNLIAVCLPMAQPEDMAVLEAWLRACAEDSVRAMARVPRPQPLSAAMQELVAAGSLAQRIPSALRNLQLALYDILKKERIATHELGHMVGFKHTHARWDRARLADVPTIGQFKSGISQRSYDTNYGLVPKDDPNFRSYGLFDLESIMRYSWVKNRVDFSPLDRDTPHFVQELDMLHHLHSLPPGSDLAAAARAYLVPLQDRKIDWSPGDSIAAWEAYGRPDLWAAQRARYLEENPKGNELDEPLQLAPLLVR